MGGWFYSGLLGGEIAVEVREVHVSQLPRGLEGKKIAFLSDVHAGWMFPAKRVAQTVQALSALEPDLLLIGGDLAETRQDELEVIRALGTVPAPLGRYAVLGNNDSQRFMVPDNASFVRPWSAAEFRFWSTSGPRSPWKGANWPLWGWTR